MKKLIKTTFTLLIILSFNFTIYAQSENQFVRQKIDGVAAVVEEHIILKTDLAQLINMTLVQQRIDPQKDPDLFISLQKNVLHQW